MVCRRKSKNESFAATTTTSRTLDTYLHSSDKLNGVAHLLVATEARFVPFEIVCSGVDNIRNSACYALITECLLPTLLNSL